MKTKVTSGRKSSAVSAASDRPAPIHQEISALAESIWRQRGCPQGQDEAIWLEAEKKLQDSTRTERDKAGKLSDAEPYLGANLRPGDLSAELEDRFPDSRGDATTSL